MMKFVKEVYDIITQVKTNIEESEKFTRASRGSMTDVAAPFLIFLMIYEFSVLDYKVSTLR